MEDEVGMYGHTELLTRAKLRRPSLSAARHDPRFDGGREAQDAEDSVRSAAAGGAGLGGRVVHVRTFTPPIPPARRARLVTQVREDLCCEQ